MIEVIVGSAGLGILCGFIIGYGVATERTIRDDRRAQRDAEARERETQRVRALKGYRP